MFRKKRQQPVFSFSRGGGSMLAIIAAGTILEPVFNLIVKIFN